MRPTRHAAPGAPPRRVGRVLRGLLGLALLLALLAGIPAALLVVAGSPLPAGGLDPTGLARALTRRDDGTLFLHALTAVGWAAWAAFAVSLAVELAAQLRGRPAPRLPGLAGPQRAAAFLVATAALLVTAPLPSLALPATAAVAAMPVPPRSLTAPLDDAQSAHVVTPAPPPAAPAIDTSQARTYVVQRGDSLWQIAEDLLGDGARYPEIADLNYGVPQPDGRALSDDHWIHPGWVLHLPPVAAPPAQPAAASPTYEVEPGDTLWEIAEETLGDGHRYPEIAEASRGVQPDGRRLTDPDLIHPGWQLTIPADPATPTLPPAAAAPEHAAPAESAAPPLPEAAPPPGPEPATPAVPPPAVEVPSGATAPPDVSSPGPAAKPTPEQAPRAHGGEFSGEEQDSPDQDEENLPPVRTVLGVGSLLAAGLLGFLGLQRARQQRRRRPGQRIPLPPRHSDADEAEQTLRTGEDPAGLARVDAALRTLALELGTTGRSLPGLRAARLSRDGQLELYLTDPADPPRPFRPGPEPAVWTLPPDAPLPASAELAAVLALYPGLVTVGHDLDDAHVLLDLEHAGALTVHGPPAEGRAVLAALALELATSLWADDLQVTVVGFLPDLPDALPTGRARHVPALSDLLPALERRASTLRAALAANKLPDAHQARTIVSSRSDAWTPEVVLLDRPLDEPDQARLADVVLDSPGVGIAAVILGEPELSEWRLRFDPTAPGFAVLDPLGLTVRPQQLHPEQLEQVLQLLRLAEQQPDAASPPHYTATDPGEQGSSAPEDDGTAALFVAVEQTGDTHVDTTDAVCLDECPEVPETAEGEGDRERRGARDTGQGEAVAAPRPDAPMIRVLGPVDVVGARGAVEGGKRRQLTELAAWMVLHPGQDHYALNEAMWPGARSVTATRNTAVSKLRKWLGTAPDGSEYVPRVLDDGYRLHAVRSDWNQWQQLLAGAPERAPTEALIAALQLVRGQPFAATNPRRYAWAERDRQEMISAVVDAAHELIRRAFKDGNAPLARLAAAVGLQADPGAELLWRDALRAEWLAGDLDGLTATADRLTALAEELGDDLEPETVDLLEELLRRRRAHVTAKQ